MAKFLTLRLFCQQTCLHGFSFILQSPTYIQSFIFLILIIISTVMMARDGISLAEKFVSEPTKIDLMVMTNETFNIDRPTFCFVPTSFDLNSAPPPIYSTWDRRHLNLDINSHQLAFNYSLDFESTLNVLDGFLNEYEYNISAIHSVAYALPNHTVFSDWYNRYSEILTVLYQTVATILAAEHKLLSTTSSWISYIAEGNSETVRQYLLDKQIDFDQLTEFVAHIVCRRSQFQFLTSIKQGMNDSFCNIAEFTWFGFTDRVFPYDDSPKVCYKFPSPMEFESSADVRTFKMLGITNQRTTGHHTCHVLLDFSGRQTFFKSHSQSVTLDICNRQQEVKLSITSEVQSYNLARKPCRDYDRLNCRLQCQIDFYTSNCKCQPINRIKRDWNRVQLTYCAALLNLSHDFANISVIKMERSTYCNSENDTIKLCQLQCPAECLRRQFGFLFGDQSQGQVSDIRIFIADFVYPIFKESLLLTWSDLLMAFGGSIGFWLGASIIAFAHAIIFFLSNLCVKLVTGGTKCRNPQETVNQPP